MNNFLPKKFFEQKQIPKKTFNNKALFSQDLLPTNFRALEPWDNDSLVQHEAESEGHWET
jgi:hypothetical protein